MRAAMLFVLVLSACATGADPPVTGDDTSEEPDAEVGDDRPDARPRPDASELTPPDAEEPPPDAEVEPPPDGSVTGAFCFSNAECPAADDCCVGFGPGNPGFCGPGTEVGDYCLPD